MIPLKFDSMKMNHDQYIAAPLVPAIIGPSFSNRPASGSPTLRRHRDLEKANIWE